MKSECWYVHALGKKRQKWGGSRTHMLMGGIERAEFYV